MRRKMNLVLILLALVTFVSYSEQLVSAENLSSDTSLFQVNINGEPITFDQGSLIKEIILPSGAVSVPEVTATADEPGVKIEITPAASLPGDTAITLTAQDGTVITYTIKFSLEVVENKNYDVTLKNIWIDTKPLTNFTPLTQVYDMELPEGVTTASEVTAEANDSKAVVEISPAKDLPGDTVITVTAEDGTVMTYIIRFSVPLDANKSQDATLCEIRINGQLLDDFASNKNSYVIELPNGTANVPEVTAEANDSKATVMVNPAASLPGDAGIVVTAEDGTVMAYTLKFTIAASKENGKKADIKYDFDEVEVVYAAEFMADPVKISENGWLTDLAGGAGKSVKVTLGVVSLEKDGRAFMEGFIKFMGANGSERFLLNSRHYEYYGETNRVKTISSQFWSAKILDGNTVIKDFTSPIKAVVLVQEFDENQKITDMSLKTYYDYKTGWEAVNPEQASYHADMDTLDCTGEPIVYIN